MEAVAGEDVHPVRVVDAVDGAGAGWSPGGAVVLVAGADVVGLGIVIPDLIGLADGDVVEVLPMAAKIAGDVDAAIDANNHVAGVRRVDPHGVKVWVDLGAAVGDEGLAAILGEGDTGELAAALESGDPDAGGRCWGRCKSWRSKARWG